MTDHRIRYILSGIKEEIRREKDRERIQQLCIQGMQWNRELINFIPDSITEPERNSMICRSCDLLLPLRSFSKAKIAYMKAGKQLSAWYYRLDCKECTAAEARAKKVKRCKKNIFGRSLPRVRAVSDI